jgi:LacI family transcriptional regulator
MVTLKDISRSLGLSITTVSRALNGFPEVNAETRRLVASRAEELGYRPNKFAQKLVTGRSGLVGIVLKAPPDLVIDKLFVEMLTGLSAIFSTMDRDFVLNITSEAEEMTAIRRLVARGTLDGFILTEPRENDPRVDFLTEKGARFVLHGRVTGNETYPYYDIDNIAVGETSARHLLRLGHRRIAYLNGTPNACYALERQTGWLAAHSEAGVPADAGLMFFGAGTGDHGNALLHRLLAGPDRPTAVICHNTQVAMEVYAAAADLGLKIPGELSVIAHDDGLPGIDAAAFEPPLTVTSCPIRQAIGPLARILDGCIAGEPLENLQEIDRFALVERESTAAPAGAAKDRPRVPAPAGGS